MRTGRILLIFTLILIWNLVLTGCLNRQTPAEEIYEILESVVEIEKTFEEQQEPLVRLEKKDQELYEEIIELNIQETNKEVVERAITGISIAEQRREHMDKEQLSMDESKAEFEKVKGIIGKMDDSNLKEKALNVYDFMQERYKIHNEIYRSYTNGLEQDIAFYNIVKEEKMGEGSELEAIISQGNEAYKEVQERNKAFNEKTAQYNQAKLDFYHSANIISQTN